MCMYTLCEFLKMENLLLKKKEEEGSLESVKNDDVEGIYDKL